MEDKTKEGVWRFAVGIVVGIVLYKLIFDVLIPMFS